MKFSICLPVFDRPAMLANALRTVARQTHYDLEVVVKDGCLARPAPQDGEVQAAFRSLAHRVRYVLSADRGIFPALNEALRYATGDVLYFMCSDDELGDEKTLEAVAAVLGRFGGPAWVYGQMAYIDEDGVEHGVCGSRVEFARLQEGNCIVQPAVFWNRLMFRSVGYFNERYAHAADYDYWLRCWKVSPGVYMPRILGRFRRWRGSHTTSNLENQFRDARLISLEHKKPSIQGARHRLTADGIRCSFRRLQLGTEQAVLRWWWAFLKKQAVLRWWWAFLKITGPIRRPLGLRQEKIVSVLARIGLLSSR